MKLIIAGGRDIRPNFGFIDGAIRLLEPHSKQPIREVVSGGASGIDTEAQHWASHRGITVSRFPADWEKYGKSAGPRRNAEMARYADALLLIWDGKSRGSASMKLEMTKLKKPIYEVILSKENV